MKSTLIIGGASEDHDRHEMDFYPTPPECTHALMQFINLPRESKVWEPACGDGAISEVMNKYVSYTYSTDIRDDSGYGYGGIDFMTSERYGDMVVTNPPFNIAENFIKRCNELELEMFAMLLKSQYWHSKGRCGLFQKITPAFILPLTWRPNFAPNRGNSPTMDMLWTVWLKGSKDCKYIPLKKPSLQKTLF